MPASLGTLKRRLRALRGDATQSSLATIARVSAGTLSNWESGRHEPTVGGLGRLALHFGVSLDYLVGITDVQKPRPKSRQPK